uniref:SLC12 domain-containing protein n=1 Tax=Heligmosomoides polygyrus TaxID=6339 RepID=A0A183GUB3_HELPZ
LRLIVVADRRPIASLPTDQLKDQFRDEMATEDITTLQTSSAKKLLEAP